MRALINIVAKADNQDTALEYIGKIEELIGESDYYDILKSRGINIETLHSYYASRFNNYPLFTENIADF